MASKAYELTAHYAAAAIKARKMTASDYIGGLISRISEREPELEAWQYLDADGASKEAAKLDAKQDLAALPLAGVGVGVKDIIDTADMPTENGTVLDAGRRPAEDAAVVRLLREAGAIIMGKTVTTELAYMQPSKTKNPHNTRHTPGGSSSGSAAAVAAGMVPVALGTQTNGSVIRPGSFCGVYSLKPTFGLFPRQGVLEESGTFDTVGIFARTIEDIAAVTEVLATAGDRPGLDRNYLDRAGETPGNARFAFVKTPAWGFAEEPTKDAFETFAKDLGPACEELTLPPEFDRAIGFHRTIMMAEIALNFGHYYERGKDRLSRVMRDAIELGQSIRATDYAEALRERENLNALLSELLQPYDAIITPSAGGPAPIGQDTTGNPVFCTLWTYLGTPALNVPLLTVNGMPMGVQLVGRRFEEGHLFKAANALVASARR